MLVQQLSPEPQLFSPPPPAAQLGPVTVAPEQLPPVHAPVAQGQGVVHCPDGSHICMAVPLHLDWPGEHEPTQAPPTQVVFTQPTEAAPQV
jgi:hypothetical protein